jgi:Na+/proline symporter/signal transduction histidine kinase
MNFDADIAIFIAFLIINLIIGLFASKGIKNIKEYAIGNRNFSTATITATIVATWLFGSVVSFNLAETYNNGLYFIIPGIADGISFFIVAYFYAPRMKEFLGQLSVAEAMGSLYGKQIRLITAICGLIPAVGNIAVQFSIFTILLKYLFGDLNIYILLISSLIVITYSTLGGIKSVTFTDMIQFFTFGVVIPMMVFLIWKEINNIDAISNVFTSNPLFNYKEVVNINNSRFLDTLLLFLFFMIPGLDPTLFQRMVMAKNTTQISRSFIIAGIIITCFYILVDFAGVLLIADKVTDINQNNVLQYIFDKYLSSWFIGLVIIGIMAMIMSTADSYINSSAILFAYDSIKVMGIELTEQKQLFLVRITALFIGILGLLLSLFLNNLLELILSTYSFYMPIVSVPLILAIFGFRSTSRAVIIGMTAGLISVIYFKIFSEIDSIIPGMIANLIFFIGSHYILGEKGGWIGIKDRQLLDNIKLERKRKFNHLVQLIKSFSFIEFCQKNTPKEERIFVYFGLFCIVTIFSNAYSLPKNLHEHYDFILTPIYYSVLTLSTIFITYPIWLEKFKNAVFISLLWNISVFYNLAFCSCLLSVIGQFNQINIVVFISSLVVIASLMRWQVATIVIIGGVIISIKSYTIFIDADIPDYMNNLKFKITYSLLLLSSILIAFFKPKQEYLEKTEEKVTHYGEKVIEHEQEIARLSSTSQKILNKVNHELRLPVGNVSNFSEMLYEHLGKSSDKYVQELSKELHKNSTRLSTMILNMLDLATLEVKKIDLQKRTINFSELVENRIAVCRKIYLQEKPLEFKLSIEPDVMIAVDANYIRQTIDNLVINAINFSDKGMITVSVQKKNGEVILIIKDQGLGIPKEELLDVFEAFKMGSNTESKAEGRGIGLALCKSVIQAHGGNITAESNGEQGATLKFTLSLR